MPLPNLALDCTGRVNRRSELDKLELGEVLSRENMYVVGIGKNKYNKKFMGSSRVNQEELTGKIILYRFRYYNGNSGITFAYASDLAGAGVLYHEDNLGVLTPKITLPHTAWPQPCFVQMKVSGNNIGLFCDGYNGIYTYDGNVGFNWTLATNNASSAVPLNPVWMTSFLDRLWVIEDESDTLYGSVNVTGGGSPTDFDDVSDSIEIIVGPSRGSELMTLYVDQEALFMPKNDSFWVLEGDSPANFGVRVVHPTLGQAARRGGCKVENAYMFLGSDFEVHSFGGTQASTKLISYNMALSGDFTKDLVAIINKTQMEQVCATYHNFLFRLSICEAGTVTNNLEYIYNTTNETDGLTRGNNVSCYSIYDKIPDTGDLFTGRSDAGYIMRQYQDLNWDNDAGVTSTMPVKIQTGFIRAKKLENVRVKHVWGDFNVLGAEQLSLDHYIDCRIAASDKQTVSLPISGEYNSPTTFIRIDTQMDVTSRAVLPWGRSKGLSHSLALDFNRHDIDLAFSKFYLDAIIKPMKRSHHVGI